MDNEPVTWRKFAAETRRIAADICDEAVREKYLQLAAGYDNLAQTAAARIEADTVFQEICHKPDYPGQTVDVFNLSDWAKPNP